MIEPTSYAFRSDDKWILTIDSIGWQKIQSPEYRFAGEERPDCGHVIFQYTLSGQGVLEYEETSYVLPKGSAFLVKVPSRHRYYYKDNGEPWEILWINLRGEEASRFWDLILGQSGPDLQIAEDSELIQQLWKLLGMIAEEKVTDKYQLSAAAYKWMLELVRAYREIETETSANTNHLIQKAKTFMKENYANPVTLDSLAEHCKVNKYHLCRIFQRSEQTSPLTYLRDRRVEAALALLRTTEWPIQEIGKRCGFDSPSYFGKVFREYMSMSPKEYRMKKIEFPYHAIFYEQ